MKSDCNIWLNAHNILMLYISTLSHSTLNMSGHSCCISEDIAAGWPNIWCMLCATRLQYVVLQYGMVLATSLHRQQEICAACEKLPSLDLLVSFIHRNIQYVRFYQSHSAITTCTSAMVKRCLFARFFHGLCRLF